MNLYVPSRKMTGPIAQDGKRRKTTWRQKLTERTKERAHRELRNPARRAFGKTLSRVASPRATRRPLSRAMRTGTIPRIGRRTCPAARAPARTRVRTPDRGKPILAQQPELLRGPQDGARQENRMAWSLRFSWWPWAAARPSRWRKNSIGDQLTKATKSTRKSWPSTTRSKPKGHDVHRAVLHDSDQHRDRTATRTCTAPTGIVVRIDPNKNQATMVSIPRDTRSTSTVTGRTSSTPPTRTAGAAGTIREANQLLGIGDLALRR